MRVRFLYFLMVLAFCWQSCKEKKAPSTEVLPTVNIVVAAQKTIPYFTEYVGETLGKEDIQIQSRIDGWITSINFKEGELVQKGQLLYTIDDLPIKNKIDQAEAKLAEAITIKTRNKSELDRVEPLTQMHALSLRDLDAAKANYQASASQVESAQAALRNAKIELSYTKITAPITGIIGVSKLLVGDYVGRLSTGAPLNVISSVDKIRARFTISEDEYLKFARRKNSKDDLLLNNNLPVQMILSDGSAYDLPGTINLTNRQIDATTGSLLMQAVFENPKGLIKPGQYIKLRLQTDEFMNAVLVPQQAIVQIQNIYQVFVVNDSNKVEPRVIKVGKRIGSNWIVTNGVTANEKLAIVGSAAIRPSSIIKPMLVNWNYDSTSKQ